MAKKIKIHTLHCGYMQVSESVPYGNGINLRNSAKQLLAPTARRLTLPVRAYLIEHPDVRILVDTGWCRDISPNGVYDAHAVRQVLPAHLAAFYQPWLPEGMAVHEQLAAMGIAPRDLDYVVLTHYDPDHVAGLRHVADAKRILVSEPEYFWNCRTVYQMRQPKSLFETIPMEKFYFRGSSLGTNNWAYDLLGDECIQLVNLPGHTEGLCAVLVQNGELLEHKRSFALLTSDAAFAPRNWQEMVAPGFGFDTKLQVKALQWIRDQAEKPGCAAVLCTHDPDAQPPTVEVYCA